jgi:hypothetical protein
MILRPSMTATFGRLAILKKAQYRHGSPTFQLFVVQLSDDDYVRL